MSDKPAETPATDESAPVETVTISDPNSNSRPMEVPVGAGIAEPAVAPQPVAFDAQGTARAMPRPTAWEPAPLEATEDDIKAAEERNKREEDLYNAQREGRVNPITGEIQTKEEAAQADSETKGKGKG